MPRTIAGYVTPALALSLLIGCAETPAPHGDDEAAASVKTQRVYGGQPSTEDTDAVVHLASGPESRYCSGTVVAPRLVLTARHCISPLIDGTYQCSIDGGYKSTVTRNPSNAGAVGRAYEPALVEVRIGQFPFDKEPAFGEKIYTVSTDTICRNDIAIVRVDRDLPVPPRPIRIKEPTFPGELVTVVGYGSTFTDGAGRHERHDVEILAVGESTIYPQGRESYDRTIRLGQGACPGDSGGPILADTGAVLGVSSLLENECNSDTARTYYTQLAPYRTFIEEAFADSGFEVLHEPDSSTTGTGGSGSAGAAGASTDSDSSSGGSSTSSGGSTGSGGSDATGGSAGAATDGVTIIGGRRKKDNGCSLGVVGDDAPVGRWAPLLLGLLALRRKALRRTP